MKLFLLLILNVVGGLIGANTGFAQTIAPARATNLPVLELFTSQGCSSCPSADSLFKTYAARQDVVALSMAVDYWDYLGWKDTLANAKFSKRQRTYAMARGDGQVYTPQVVINGGTHVVGSAKGDIERALKAAAATAGTAVQIRTAVTNGMIEIDLPATDAAARDTMIWLAIVQPEVQVDVKAGENRGRKLTYFNVVRDLVPAGVWDGTKKAIRHQASTLTNQANDRFAVLVQNGNGGPMVAAVWIEP